MIMWYSTAQRQLDTRMRVAGSAPDGDISKGMSAHWDFFCVEQSLFVTSAGILKITAHAVYHQTYYT